MERWNPEHSMLARLVAADDGEPLNISEADLRARLERISKEAMTAKGWNQNQRVEACKIANVLDAMARRPAPMMER